MNLPQGHVDEQVWREHIERVKTYAGTMAAYCRLHNLDYDKFVYYRGRFEPRAAKRAAAGFAEVRATKSVAPSTAVVTIAKLKSYPQMPDPKWLAELIHNLIRDR